MGQAGGVYLSQSSEVLSRPIRSTLFHRTCLNEVVRASMLHRLGLNSTHYSVHSLRAGGASDLVPQLLRSNITVDGLLLPRSYTIVIDWGTLVSIVLWPSELGDIGVNMIISVGVVVPSPELCRISFGYLAWLGNPGPLRRCSA